MVQRRDGGQTAQRMLNVELQAAGKEDDRDDGMSWRETIHSLKRTEDCAHI